MHPAAFPSSEVCIADKVNFRCGCEISAFKHDVRRNWVGTDALRRSRPSPQKPEKRPINPYHLSWEMRGDFGVQHARRRHSALGLYLSVALLPPPSITAFEICFGYGGHSATDLK
jgi:hypothetical protein